MPSPPTGLYRVAWLEELAADPAYVVNGRPMVEKVPHLLPAVLEQPALAFGTPAAFDRPDIEQTPVLGSGALRIERPEVPAFVLREANVIGKYGIVTLADRVLGETLYHAPLHLLPGAGWEDDQHLRLPLCPLSVKLPSGYHMLAGNLGNYFHWQFDALTRFDADLLRELGPGPEAEGAAVLLVPELDEFWKWESISLLVPRDVPRIALVDDGTVFVQRLVFRPNLTGGGFLPHPHLADVFDRMRAAAGPTRAPWRRIYVSRSDSSNRMLVNEAEIAARAAAAGFLPVLLGAMSVVDQIRTFAEATHVVGAHGAGLTNLMFCQPGTAVCELHMDRYVQWSFRRLAMLRGLRYGAVLGATVGPRPDWVHAQAWRLDPAVLDAVLADPRFIAG